MPLVVRGTGKEGMDRSGVSCSALSGTLFMQCWNMAPSVEVHFKKKSWYYFYKVRTIKKKDEETPNILPPKWEYVPPYLRLIQSSG